MKSGNAEREARNNRKPRGGLFRIPRSAFDSPSKRERMKTICENAQRGKLRAEHSVAMPQTVPRSPFGIPRSGIALAGALLLAFAFQAAAQVTNITLVPAGAVWRFLDNGSDQGTAWGG